MKYCNNSNKHLDGHLATHTINSQLVIGKCRTSICFFQKGVLLLSNDISYPPSQRYKVIDRALDFNIPWIFQSIPHLHSAHYSDCFAHSENTPTPIA
jgi:hypothetical protein